MTREGNATPGGQFAGAAGRLRQDPWAARLLLAAAIVLLLLGCVQGAKLPGMRGGPPGSDRSLFVRVIDDLSKAGHQPPPGVDFQKADLTEAGTAEELFAGYEGVLNLAAKIGGIGYFHEYPATILSENNKLYSMTFEAAVKHRMPVKK